MVRRDIDTTHPDRPVCLLCVLSNQRLSCPVNSALMDSISHIPEEDTVRVLATRYSLGKEFLLGSTLEVWCPDG